MLALLKAVRSAVVISVAACAGQGLPPAGAPDGEADIGYGTQPVEKVTGRVTTINEKQILASRARTVEELLRRYNIKSQSPASCRDLWCGLIILDGFPANAAIALDLNPLDIRQIDVLKDLSSTAIYGQRGRNGVMIITTRR